ncbi:DEAD/DEAH box helicase [Trueperella sp. LYQ143]|uniref:DEAD/DEAH box helicase n=1 Tax=unclassified Trueperella TaxID=2630174 RepID=UPI003983D3CD
MLDALEDEYGLTPPPEAIYDTFTQWFTDTGKQMYSHQSEALLSIVSGDHVIVATPTGSGKSLIAMQGLFTALATGQTAYYTAPLKALVSEKFFELIAQFGAHNVGMITGDTSINPQAPIICATAEILANTALRHGTQADIGLVIMDEFHFYAEPERGWAWQIPLLELTATQFVLLSATLGDTSFFVTDLNRRSGRTVSVIDDAIRPVPLHFSYCTEPIAEYIHELVTTHMAPVYVVHFSQRDAVAQAQSLQSFSFISSDHRERLRAAIGDFQFSTGFGKTLSKLLRNGIGVHHAGLLPRYRRLVERLAQAGLLVVICGTDTLGVGINVPIRTVLITSLVKFDGTQMRTLGAREFHQIAGRAGRAGFDTIGYVVVMAPEHEIENARRLRKAGDDPLRQKRVQRVKAPDGISWSEKTFDRLRAAEPETLTSQFRLSHAMILNLLQRPDPIPAIISLLTDNHHPKSARNPFIRQAIDIYSSLRTGEVIVHHDRNWRRTHPDEPAIEFTKDVPEDFALNSPLAPFAFAAFDLIDPESSEYALDIVSVVEAVQENPMPLLIAQQKHERGKLIQQLKVEGVDYYERMARADEISWPQPLAEVLTPALEIYAQANPWVRDHELSPKSVVRMMIEEAMSFSDLISRFDLNRSEGVVLRYLTDCYRAMRQMIPINMRTPELSDIITWLGNLVRAIDSSLLDEWNALANGTYMQADEGNTDVETGADIAFGAEADGHLLITRNQHAFKRAVRNAMFRRVEALEYEQYERLAQWDGACGWDAQRWEAAIDPFFDDYEHIGTDTDSRSDRFFSVLTDPSYADLLAAGLAEDRACALVESHKAGRAWLVIQVLNDGDEQHEAEMTWAIWAIVDLDASDAAEQPVIEIIRVGPR